MRFFYKILFVLTVSVSVVSCDSRGVFVDDETLAVVDDKKLTISHVKGIFSPGMTPQDSLILLESYVNMWVRQQLKVREAEMLFSESTADIEQMVNDYRNSLLTHKLDQYYIDHNIDTLITEAEIAKYYNERRSDFLLDRAIVKGRIVRLPQNYRQKAKLKELMPGEGEKYKDFHDMALKNGFTVYEFNSWTDFPEFYAELPVGRQTNYEAILNADGVTEMTQDDDLYYVYITDRKKVGDVAPLERVRSSIRQIIFHQRRLDILRNYEDSIYRHAIETDLAKIKVN